MSEFIVSEMCEGCGWVDKRICRVIRDPKWIYKHRGKCFAKVTPERAKEIEDEIRAQKQGGII